MNYRVIVAALCNILWKITNGSKLELSVLELLQDALMITQMDTLELPTFWTGSAVLLDWNLTKLEHLDFPPLFYFLATFKSFLAPNF